MFPVDLSMKWMVSLINGCIGLNWKIDLGGCGDAGGDAGGSGSGSGSEGEHEKERLSHCVCLDTSIVHVLVYVSLLQIYDIVIWSPSFASKAQAYNPWLFVVLITLSSVLRFLITTEAPARGTPLFSTIPPIPTGSGIEFTLRERKMIDIMNVKLILCTIFLFIIFPLILYLYYVYHQDTPQ